MTTPRNNERSTRIMVAALLMNAILTAAWIVHVCAFGNPGDKLQTVSVILGEKKIQAVLANTLESRIQGLLGWNTIDEDTGMLLDFLIDTRSAIHMQGMKFPIDAIWVDSSGEIKLIYENIQPDKGLTYPSMFPSRYCLEVRAGFCNKYGVKVGQKIRFTAD
jgi:uncharacterized membrane protein (UPF0127 family)